MGGTDADCGEGWSCGNDGISNGDKKETEFAVKLTACSSPGADCLQQNVLLKETPSIPKSSEPSTIKVVAKTKDNKNSVMFRSSVHAFDLRETRLFERGSLAQTLFFYCFFVIPA